jgi:TolB-like protein
MSRLKRLIVEIHQRSLWQVLGIYVVGAAVGYQLIQALTEGLGLPDWFPAFAIVLFIILLPVVLATAFVQEGVRGPRRPETLPPFIAGPDAGETPTEAAESEVAESAVGETRGVHHQVFTWRNAGLGFVIALGVWGVVATGWLLLNERAAAPATDLKFIAVLPLENLSPDPDNEFFAAGIHEDILSQLSKIRAVNVISRTSVLQYADTDKDIPTIAEELGGVDGIVEGSVRRAGDQVRVVLQLIDKTDVHLWSETYDRDLTVANVFAIQSDIAHRGDPHRQPRSLRVLSTRAGVPPTARLPSRELSQCAANVGAGRGARSELRSGSRLVVDDPLVDLLGQVRLHRRATPASASSSRSGARA